MFLLAVSSAAKKSGKAFTRANIVSSEDPGKAREEILSRDPTFASIEIISFFKLEDFGKQKPIQEALGRFGLLCQSDKDRPLFLKTMEDVLTILLQFGLHKASTDFLEFAARTGK